MMQANYSFDTSWKALGKVLIFLIGISIILSIHHYLLMDDLQNLIQNNTFIRRDELAQNTPQLSLIWNLLTSMLIAVVSSFWLVKAFNQLKQMKPDSKIFSPGMALLFCWAPGLNLIGFLLVFNQFFTHSESLESEAKKWSPLAIGFWVLSLATLGLTIYVRYILPKKSAMIGGDYMVQSSQWHQYQSITSIIMLVFAAFLTIRVQKLHLNFSEKKMLHS